MVDGVGVGSVTYNHNKSDIPHYTLHNSTLNKAKAGFAVYEVMCSVRLSI